MKVSVKAIEDSFVPPTINYKEKDDLIMSFIKMLFCENHSINLNNCDECNTCKLIDNNVKFIISNSYKGKIDTNKLGIERYSTKGKKHGYGLLFVKHILGSNTMFDSQNEIIKNLYIQNIKYQ